MGNSTLDPLRSQISSRTSILNAWNFAAASGYSTGQPAYLSFDVGILDHPGDLEVWQYNGSAWSAYPATDLNYDGEYANFTVTALGGYAVTVPEPGTLGLLAAGLFGLLAYASRKRGRK